MNVTPRIIDVWKAYAREFLGLTSYLHGKIAISYNKWFIDESYRRDLSERLDLTFSDKGLKTIAPSGGGSSFMESTDDARNLHVLDRWRHYAEDKRYRRLFRDKELVELSERIFGHIDGTDILL